jgi:type IV secretion system protein VirB10
MSDAPSNPSSSTDDFDPHRFTVEPKKKSDKKFLSIASSLGFIGLVVAGTLWFGKWQLTTYFAGLTKARESQPADTTSKPEKPISSAAISFPKLGLQAESAKSSLADKDTGNRKVGQTISAQAAEADKAIPVIDERKSALSSRGDVPANGKNMDRGGGPQNATAEIPMMLESVAAPQKKQVVRSPVQAPQGSNSAQDASNNSSAQTVRPRTVEAMAAIKAEQTAISATAQSTSAYVGDRSRVILRGSYIECILESQLISNIPGITACIVPSNVYSDNGKRLLIRKGSKLVGEYSATVKIGDSRFGVMWQRIKTPEGVVIDVDSGAADSVGAMGLNGAFDSHWAERLGSAFMFSIIADGISTVLEPRSSPGVNGTTVVQPSATVDTAQNFAKAQIQASVATPPTFFKSRGDRVSVFVNRDLWFQ